LYYGLSRSSPRGATLLRGDSRHPRIRTWTDVGIAPGVWATRIEVAATAWIRRHTKLLAHVRAVDLRELLLMLR
jgi:hypothetical protein